MNNVQIKNPPVGRVILTCCVEGGCFKPSCFSGSAQPNQGFKSIKRYDLPYTLPLSARIHRYLLFIVDFMEANISLAKTITQVPITIIFQTLPNRNVSAMF